MSQRPAPAGTKPATQPLGLVGAQLVAPGDKKLSPRDPKVVAVQKPSKDPARAVPPPIAGVPVKAGLPRIPSAGSGASPRSPVLTVSAVIDNNLKFPDVVDKDEAQRPSPPPLEDPFEADAQAAAAARPKSPRLSTPSPPAALAPPASAAASVRSGGNLPEPPRSPRLAPLSTASQSKIVVMHYEQGEEVKFDYEHTEAARVVFGSKGGELGQFREPWGIAADPQTGNVVVADSGNHRVQIFAPTGSFVRAFGSYGVGDGQFNMPRGLAINKQEEIIVVDSGNHRVQVFSMSGIFLRKFGTFGSEPGRFNCPWDVAVNQKSEIIVADTQNDRIQIFDITGAFISRFGGEGETAGRMLSPTGVACDRTNRIYVADQGNRAIQIYDHTGKFIMKFGTPGSGINQFSGLSLFIHVDIFGLIYVADSGNFCVQVYDENGKFLRKFGFFGEGPGMFNSPAGVFVDLNQRVYVSDRHNHRVEVF